MRFKENKQWLKTSNHQLKTAKNIHALMQAAYQVEADLIGVDSFPPLRRTIKEIMSAKTIFYGSFEENKLIAMIEFSEENPQTTEVHSLVVHPQYFGQGLATGLLMNLINLISNKFIKVSTARANKPAIGLYQKHGFQITQLNQTDCGIKVVEMVFKNKT